MADFPSGIVTLLFTDVDRSTELVKRLQERYSAVLAAHRDLLRAAFLEHSGTEVDTQGDAFFVAFARVREAVAAAVAAQRALADYPWPDDISLSVRMGLHTGEPYRSENGFTGLAVHRAARICTIAHGGQVLLSRSTAGLVDDEQIPGISVLDLGEHRLKDLDRPERIYLLVAEGLPANFAAPRTIDQQMPLMGTVTVVGVEGRRVMGLHRDLTPETFGALLADYQRLLQELFAGMGGREVNGVEDTAMAVFPTAKQAAFAAVAAQRAVTTHAWPERLRLAVSIGLHSGEAGIGWVGPAAFRCAELCDAAEGGQIFLSQATAGLLEDENLGELEVRDLGELTTRRTQRAVRAYELVVPSAAKTTV